MTGRLDASLAGGVARQDLARRWRGLEKDADGSFFTSWSWIGPWLEASGDAPFLFAAVDGERDVALALVSPRWVRRGWAAYRTLFVNQSGRPALDEAYVEYKGLLASRGREQECYAAFARLLRNRERLPPALRGWSELRVAGTSETVCTYLQTAGFIASNRIEERAPFVDLEKVRGAGDYLSLLSRNTRQAVQRAQRLYEEDAGPLGLEIAEDAGTAEIWLDGLVALQIERFRGLGKTSNFERQFLKRFIRLLLDDLRAVDILRLGAGREVLGYLVNLRHGKIVANYQSGFRTTDDNRLKPGLVAHALAVERYARDGFHRYDFLAGASQYKSSLATDADTLSWLTLR